jgi:colanic acid biosynthesis glycosyl transferase WcaI
MKILIAHRYFWPENISLFPRMIKDIAEWHMMNGDEVTILTSRSGGHADRTEWSQKHNVVLREISVKSDRGANIFYRLSNIIRFINQLTRELLFQKYDLVVTTSYPPVLAATVVRLLKKRCRYRYVYYLQDIFPELLLQQRGLRKLLGRILRSIDQKNIEHSAATITLSNKMKKTIERRDTRNKNISVIQNYTIEQPCIVEQRALQSRLSLIFAGNMGKLQNIQHCLLSSQRAFVKMPHDFLLVGEGSEQQNLKKFVLDNNLRHVQFHKKVSRDAALVLMSKANVGVVAGMPHLFGIAYPSKILSYFFVGLPALVFTEAGQEIDAELQRFGLGVTASPTDPEDAANSIVKLLQDIKKSRYTPKLIQKTGIHLFSKERYFSKYQTLVSDLRKGT